MNKDNAHLYLPLVQALAEGKTLQRRQAGEWKDYSDPHFLFQPDHYRIKPPEPVVFEEWMTVYPATTIFGGHYRSREDAEQWASKNCISLLHVTITDGVPKAEFISLCV